MRVALQSVTTILVLLQTDRAIDQFNYHVYHWPDLNGNTLAHLSSCIRVPFVALAVLDDPCLSAIDQLGLIDCLL